MRTPVMASITPAVFVRESTAGNGDERREESADAELHNVTAQNGDHVYPPVETGDARGGREQKGCDGGGENRLDVGPGGAEFSADRHHERDEEKRPENAMGNHLHGAGSFEQVPVDGHETPAEIGDDGSGESEPEVRLQSFGH